MLGDSEIGHTLVHGGDGGWKKQMGVRPQKEIDDIVGIYRPQMKKNQHGNFDD